MRRYRERFVTTALTLALILGSTAGHAGGLAIVETLVSDNGDGDGFADTRETVTLQLRVRNTSAGPLSGVTARIVAADGTPACVSDDLIVIGNLAAGEELVTADAFVFTTSDLDRAALGLGPFDLFAAEFELSVASTPPVAAVPARIALDLDLNVGGGAGPSTAFESFEGSLGSFEVQNLDEGLYGPAASQPYHCQTHDPGNPNSLVASFPNPIYLDHCYFGASLAHLADVYWGLSGPGLSPLGGRGFSGFHSLFFGVDLGPPLDWTTPLGVMEAAALAEPVALGWSGAASTLSFKHQSRLYSDYFTIPGEALDRGVVMVQTADEQGNGVGPWIKVYPFQNAYDSPAALEILGCLLDPIDDGNDEDDFFEPLDPDRLMGPSSTCAPEPVFADVGETSSPFAPGNLGRADGPGLAGMWGIGTWVESTVDLSRFRGRQVRVRFLATTIKGSTDVPETWEEIYVDNPYPEEDGWWIDDVTISGTLSSPASVAVDDTENGSLPAPLDGDLDGAYDVCDNCPASANMSQADIDRDGTGDGCDACPLHAFVLDFDGDLLCAEQDNCPLVANPGQADGDADGAGTVCDCNDGHPATHPGAAETNDGLDNNCPGDAGYGVTDEISGALVFSNPANPHVMSWPAQSGAARYQVARATSADFSTGCVAFSSISSATYTNNATPSAATTYFYLVRASHPNLGSWGTDSSGTPRVVPCAP